MSSCLCGSKDWGSGRAETAVGQFHHKDTKAQSRTHLAGDLISRVPHASPLRVIREIRGGSLRVFAHWWCDLDPAGSTRWRSWPRTKRGEQRSALHDCGFPVESEPLAGASQPRVRAAPSTPAANGRSRPFSGLRVSVVHTRTPAQKRGARAGASENMVGIGMGEVYCSNCFSISWSSFDSRLLCQIAQPMIPMQAAPTRRPIQTVC